MYAVIETGGKQYRVSAGESIEVETLDGPVGAEVEFNRVLAVVEGESVRAGSDVENARVKGTITAHGRGDKVLVFKFKRKKQYKRLTGHRQNLMQVKINDFIA